MKNKYVRAWEPISEIALLNEEIDKLKDLLRDALKELWQCRERDGAGPYDPTLKSRIDSALAKKRN